MLDSGGDISGNWDRISENMNAPAFNEYLRELTEKREIEIAELASKALLSRSFTYQIFSGARMPGRDAVVRIALALKLSLDETQRLLKLADRGALYPKVKRDAAIIYAINNDYNLYQTDELLAGLGQERIL